MRLFDSKTNHFECSSLPVHLFAVLFGFKSGVISNYFAVDLLFFWLLRADLLVHTFLILMCSLYILINN